MSGGSLVRELGVRVRVRVRVPRVHWYSRVIRVGRVSRVDRVRVRVSVRFSGRYKKKNPDK